MRLRDLLGRRARKPGWLAVSFQPGRVSFAHAIDDGERATITRCGTRAVDDAFNKPERIARDLALDRYACTTVLASQNYQLLLVDAPNVPATEMKTAVRWKLKDMLDYRLEEATVDVLDIPAEKGGARGHWVYAVAAHNESIRECIRPFEEARIPLEVIDIAETAQRNVAALFESPERGLAFLHVGEAVALLTVNFDSELYLARRIDVGMESLVRGDEASREEALGRIGLEVQRSFDHFDRQFSSIRIDKLLLGPEPKSTGLQSYLSSNLDLPVENARLDAVLSFAAEAALDAETAWRLFPLLGAALRADAKRA